MFVVLEPFTLFIVISLTALTNQDHLMITFYSIEVRGSLSLGTLAPHHFGSIWYISVTVMSRGTALCARYVGVLWTILVRRL